jgi:hypothetical protein
MAWNCIQTLPNIQARVLAIMLCTGRSIRECKTSLLSDSSLCQAHVDETDRVSLIFMRILWNHIQTLPNILAKVLVIKSGTRESIRRSQTSFLSVSNLHQAEYSQTDRLCSECAGMAWNHIQTLPNILVRVLVIDYGIEEFI